MFLKQVLICPPPPQFCSKNFSALLYNEDKSIAFTKQERKRYVIELLFSELS